MISQALEIKVALLGYVSVGKTTVLNALFQDKYGEVSMRRTTAGVNFFRISTRSNQGKRKSDENAEGQCKIPRTEESEEMEWVADLEEPRSPVSTLAEITADNAVLRETNKIQEKTFDIELDDPLCEMRKDTKLILVDIPGVNEAGSNKIYMDYVNKTWDTFDCAIVVLDAKVGANTEEQIHLLQQVKRNFSTKKEIPLIVLCNKVDDPDNDEMKTLVDEVRGEVERIFEVSSRAEALKDALDARKASRGSMWPAVIPISAENAFLYRTACRLEMEDFKKLDTALIDKIGREEVGRMKWKKLSQKKKYEVAFAAVSDESQYQERLEDTQFDLFLDVLALTCGGEAVQDLMIQHQIDVIVRNHFSWEQPMADNLLSIYQRCKAVGMPADTLRQGFWSEYSELEEHAYSAFSSEMNSEGLVGAVGQLSDYFERFVTPVYDGDEDVLTSEKGLVIAAMERLIERQVGIICEKESLWDVAKSRMMASPDLVRQNGQWRDQKTGQCYQHSNNIWDSPFHWQKEGDLWKSKITNETIQGEKNPGLREVNWTHLSPHDWFTIVRSLLLLSYSKHFCLRFGHEIRKLEGLALQGKAAKILLHNDGPTGTYCRYDFGSSSSFSSCRAAKNEAAEKLDEYSRGTYHSGVFSPANETKFGILHQIEMPKNLSNPKHWGHVAWKFCEFMEKN